MTHDAYGSTVTSGQSPKVSDQKPESSPALRIDSRMNTETTQEVGSIAPADAAGLPASQSNLATLGQVPESQSAAPKSSIETRTSTKSGQGQSGEDSDANNFLELIKQKCFENYHTVAYTLIIVTYFIAFIEYLYFRLVSLIVHERIIYKRNCHKHFNETIVRFELHYASAIATFLVMAGFQLFFFFFLTVSSKWLEVRRNFTRIMSMEQRLRNELAFELKRVMFVTVLPTFSVYSMCSIVIICAIFYMVGLRDPVYHVGSRVLIYPIAWVCQPKTQPHTAHLSEGSQPQVLQVTQNEQTQSAPVADKRRAARRRGGNEPVGAPAPISPQSSAPQQKPTVWTTANPAGSGRTLQQWGKQQINSATRHLPTPPTINLPNPRLRIAGDTGSKYQRLSDESPNAGRCQSKVATASTSGVSEVQSPSRDDSDQERIKSCDEISSSVAATVDDVVVVVINHSDEISSESASSREASVKRPRSCDPSEKI
ncbi:hypothetical protein Ddc_18409 [Ditylenchus destructor]|nr:hypothetical protein Ddc_18409 [Ditylenchus destructor]